MKQVMDDSIGQLSGAASVSGILVLEHNQLDGEMHEHTEWDRYILVIDEECPSHPYHAIQVSNEDRSVTRWTCVHPDEWEDWITSIEVQPLISSFGRADIVVDRSGALTAWQKRLKESEKAASHLEYMKTYACFLDCYTQAKHFLQMDYLLDACRYMDQAFYYWARLAIMDQGEMPRAALWQQVKCLNLGVYKMYEEFMMSSESMSQRIQLALLACEFSLSSKITESCAPLLEWMKQAQGPVPMASIMQHTEFKWLGKYLPTLLKKLVHRGYLHEKLMEHQTPYGNLGSVQAYEWVG